ncbi:ParD-like family protein [Pseudomonas panipatensis]|uniref:ParD-like family protein n=1 Tax=Pseudomonas panipatensis TaxID=428992 RepID=UPI0035B464B5
MGILKISDAMHENLRLSSSALSRSINAQAEHWLRLGMLTELYPDLNHSQICRLLIRAEEAGGLSLSRVCELADESSASRSNAAAGHAS